MTNYGPNEILDLNISFERSLSKLSENHEIGSIIKCMAVERCSTTPPPPFNQWFGDSQLP